MKRILYLAVLFISIAFVIKAQTVDGYLNVIENNDTSYVVKLKIKLENGSADLGISSIRYQYDTTSLFFPATPVQNKDYKIVNFNFPDYFSSVSHPSSSTISINIAQMGSAGNTITTDTMDITTIYFKKIGHSYLPPIYPVLVQFFSPQSATQWEIGDWKGYTPTKIDNSKEIIDNFNLMQNYPNPFNPTTTIKYQIPANSFVTLKIYNIIGQEVATLVNKMEITGSYSVRFNADKLASGIYIYTLQAGSMVKSKKMILLK
jgi:hypothetical protein